MATTPATPTLPTQSSMSAKAHRGPSVGPRSFAEVTGNGKKPPTPKKKVHPRQIEAAARRFSPPTNTTGFKYVYLHQKHRMTIRQLRDTLRKLKIDNSRILDVHFPDCGVVGLLIHNDFEQELTETLLRRGVSLHTDFDPLSETVVRDPAFAGKSKEERAEEAHILFYTRCHRSLDFLKTPHVQLAVARDFHLKEWITEKDYTAVLAAHQSKKVQHHIPSASGNVSAAADILQPAVCPPSTTQDDDEVMGENSSQTDSINIVDI